MDPVVVRRATPGDAEAIGRFQTLAWDQAYRGLVPDANLDATTWRDRARRWRARLDSGERAAWLALAGEAVVGVSSSAATAEGRPDLPGIELASLYVHAHWHGGGTAARLLETAIGDGPAHLWVFTANARAMRFYEKHGFAPSGEETCDPGTGLREARWVRSGHVTGK